MFDVKTKVKEFMTKHRNKCFALANWKNLKMKNYGMNEMLECICNAANGSIQEMANIVDHLTSKDKVFGRTQVYADRKIDMIDLIRNENGELVLKGYNPDAELPLKGQHQKKNPKIFRKSDGGVSKVFQKSEEKMKDLGAKVREMFPGQDKQYITFAMKAIRDYAEQKKIHTDKVINGLKKGRYTLDDDLWRIVPKVVKENKVTHTIVINESDLERVTDIMDMTEHKFNVNMKHFISTLLQDPVNAKVPYIFAQRNFTRSSLLNYLLGGKNPILIRDQKISDKDENGEPKTATMIVKFRCPKKNFERKLEKLFIRMFEKNLPPRQSKDEEVEMDEATSCGEASGAFVTGAFPIQRRQAPYTLEETTATTTVGKTEYASPAGLGDKESRARRNGEGGSVSINHTKK